MSANSWCEEFYPIEADEACSRIDYECVEHALKKWTGALPENLKKHEVEYQNFEIMDIHPKSKKAIRCVFGSVTCSFCNKYYWMQKEQVNIPYTRTEYHCQ